MTLNIWTKALGIGVERLKPVLIFFYGGRKRLVAPTVVYLAHR